MKQKTVEVGLHDLEMLAKCRNHLNSFLNIEGSSLDASFPTLPDADQYKIKLAEAFDRVEFLLKSEGILLN